MGILPYHYALRIKISGSDRFRLLRIADTLILSSANGGFWWEESKVKQVVILITIFRISLFWKLTACLLYFYLECMSVIPVAYIRSLKVMWSNKVWCFLRLCFCGFWRTVTKSSHIICHLLDTLLFLYYLRDNSKKLWYVDVMRLLLCADDRKAEKILRNTKRYPGVWCFETWLLACIIFITNFLENAV